MSEPNISKLQELPDEQISEILQEREFIEKGIVIDHSGKKVICEHCSKSPNYNLKDIMEHVKLHDGIESPFLIWLRDVRARQRNAGVSPYFQALLNRDDYDFGHYLNVPYQQPGLYVTFIPVVPLPMVQRVIMCTCCANCDGDCDCHYTAAPLVCGNCPACVNNRANGNPPNVIPQLYPVTYSHYPIFPQYTNAPSGLYTEYRPFADDDDAETVYSTEEEDELTDEDENPEEDQHENETTSAILVGDDGLMYYLSDLVTRIAYL